MNPTTPIIMPNTTPPTSLRTFPAPAVVIALVAAVVAVVLVGTVGTVTLGSELAVTVAVGTTGVNGVVTTTGGALPVVTTRLPLRGGTA